MQDGCFLETLIVKHGGKKWTYIIASGKRSPAIGRANTPGICKCGRRREGGRVGDELEKEGYRLEKRRGIRD